MAEALPPPQQQLNYQARRDDWIARVNALVDQIEAWAQAENWETERHQKQINERLLGAYAVPELVVRLQGGYLTVNPIALHTVGGNGRIDIEAIPTLSRVKLVGVEGGWEIWTDSNVPLRVPFDGEHFVQLAHDLLA